MRIGSDTVFLERRADVVAYLNSVFAALAGESYARSELLNTSICVLTDSTAIVSTGIRRFDSNGAVLLETGATYALVKFDSQ